jgi:Putative auto-transporter adhesin, head GIN domain
MKKILVFVLLFSAGSILYAQDGRVINDKNAQTREAKGFHAIHISNGIDLYLSKGPEALAVSASGTETRDRIKTEVENGVLRIYMENNGLHWNWSNQHLRAYVSASALDELNASGGSDVYVQDEFSMPVLKIELSGGSDFKGKLTVPELSFHQSGGSDVHVSGTTSNLNIVASGGSDFIGYDLVSDICHISSSGGSDAKVTVNKELSASASGGSDIYYKGHCSVKEAHSGGSSTVSRD